MEKGVSDFRPFADFRDFLEDLLATRADMNTGF